MTHGSDTFGPQRHLDPGDTWTPRTLRPQGHLDPGDTWSPGTLGPRRHLDPRDTWTLDIWTLRQLDPEGFWDHKSQFCMFQLC